MGAESSTLCSRLQCRSCSNIYEDVDYIYEDMDYVVSKQQLPAAALKTRESRSSAQWPTPCSTSTPNTLPASDNGSGVGLDAIIEDDDNNDEGVEDGLLVKNAQVSFKKSNGNGHGGDQDATLEEELHMQYLARQRLLAYENKIINTFNIVMLTNGLKVLKHYDCRSSSKDASVSRVLKFSPDDRGGALVWRRSKQTTARTSVVALLIVRRVEREDNIVWVTAGNHRIGFEPKQLSDAQLLCQALIILIDRAHGSTMAHV